MAAPQLASNARKAGIALVTLAGLFILGFFTHHLYREDLKDWQRVEVLFEDVGGLRKKDDVLVGGARMGRVAEVLLFEDEQLVILEVEPGLPIHQDASVKIVSANSLGFVDVELRPGSVSAPLHEPGVSPRLRGTLFVGVGQGSPEPGRLKQLRANLHEFARETAEIRDPRSGTWGKALFDSDRAEGVAVGLRQLADQWRGADEALARLEGGEGLGRGLDRAQADQLITTLGNARAALDKLAGGATRASRGQGQAGLFLTDPVEARSWRTRLAGFARALSAARRGEGTLGAWTHPANGDALPETIRTWRESTDEALQGRGLLGALTSRDSGRALRDVARGARRGLAELERNPAVRDRNARHAAFEGVAEVDDGLLNLRRVVESIRADLPNRTNFTGAVFAIF